jgi:putative ABC transport system substrate-binding protein
MRRREVITLLGAAAAAWPLAAHAQRSDRERRVGALIGWSESDPEPHADVEVFRHELAKLGWIEGRNLRIDFYYGEGDAERMRSQAAEIARLAPDVIFTVSAAATRAVQEQTQTIPIVVAGAGPLSNGELVRDTARPEGNTTGFANTFPSMNGKSLEFLKEIAPHVTRVAFVINLGTSVNGANGAEGAAAAQRLGVEWIDTQFRKPSELEHAIDSFAAEPNGGMIVSSAVYTVRQVILELAARHRLPMISAYRSYPAEGGLMSYGSDPADWYRVAASYVDRILRGAKPSELPVQFPTKLQLVINLKTAKALGLTMPPTLRALADQLIE